MASLLFSALSGIGSSLLSNLASSAAETIGQIGSKAVKTIGQVATRRLERTVKNKPQLDNKELTVIKGQIAKNTREIKLIQNDISSLKASYAMDLEQ